MTRYPLHNTPTEDDNFSDLGDVSFCRPYKDPTDAQDVVGDPVDTEAWLGEETSDVGEPDWSILDEDDLDAVGQHVDPSESLVSSEGNHRLPTMVTNSGDPLATQLAIASGPKKFYKNLSPLSVWATDDSPELGYDDRHRVLESLLINPNRSDGWVTLEAKQLLKLLGKGYRDVLESLEEWGRLEIDRHYIVGSHCRRYRLTRRGVPTRRTITHPAQLARYYRWIGERREILAEMLKDPIYRVLYDSAAAIRIDQEDLPSLASEALTDAERQTLGLQVRQALTAHLRPFLSKDASGRLYHAHTATPKVIYRAARLNGEPLTELDVRASHWLSFLQEYSRDPEARPQDVEALRRIYAQGRWEILGGKDSRNAFLCGGRRDKTSRWLKRNAPHALRWFCEQRLSMGRGIYKLWIRGERERARRMYEALIEAGITSIVDKHDGFDVPVSLAPKAFEVASAALREVTGGLGELACKGLASTSYLEGDHRLPTMVTNSTTPEATHLPDPTDTIANDPTDPISGPQTNDLVPLPDQNSVISLFKQLPTPKQKRPGTVKPIPERLKRRLAKAQARTYTRTQLAKEYAS